MRNAFPKDFLWGTATAALQIEGSVKADGKSESNWDHYARIPGKVHDGTTPDVACDHYRLWKEDVALMKSLGVNAYRFSLSWSRIIPDGKGKVNEKGVDFYSRLVDELLANGITPFVTLWHGEHPQVLDDMGGWADRGMIPMYADFADACFERLGDRVTDWITLNEPNCFLHQGFATGQCPPGVRDWKLAYQAAHNSLVAHGEAVKRFRASGRSGRIGITMSCQLWESATDSPRDRRAAELVDMRENLMLLDPIHLGKYPEEYIRYIGDLAPQVAPDDMETMSAKCDFLGVNYYCAWPVKAGTLVQDRTDAVRDIERDPTRNYAAGLPQLLQRFNERYGPQPIYITENGSNDPADALAPDGTCHDPARVEYLKAHVAALADAIKAGVDVRGYFIWSLMDNFEWSGGHRPRYGICYTDYATQRRIPKSSAKWYRDFLTGR